jgi:hypothetical protein
LITRDQAVMGVCAHARAFPEIEPPTEVMSAAFVMPQT